MSRVTQPADTDLGGAQEGQPQRWSLTPLGWLSSLRGFLAPGQAVEQGGAPSPAHLPRVATEGPRGRALRRESQAP